MLNRPGIISDAFHIGKGCCLHFHTYREQCAAQGEVLVEDRMIENTKSDNPQILAEHVRLLYVKSPFALIGAVVVSAASCALFWDETTRESLSLWFAAICLLSVIRWLIGRNFFKHFETDNLNATYWVSVYSAGALISGLLWGLLPWWVLDASSIFNVISVSLILFGMTAAALGSHASYPITYACYAVPVVALLVIRVAMEGGEFLYLAMMMIAYIVVYLGYSISQYRLTTTSIRQRFENMALVSDLELKNSEAEKANADKSRFLAATSHDLRQPLHSLDLYLGVLKVELEDDKLEEVLSRAMESSRALRELLNALLDVSLFDAGEVAAKRHPIHLHAFMQDIANEWQPQFADQGRELRIKSMSAEMESDPVLLMRLLRNLVINARRHTQGNVLVGARRRDGVIRIEVWDQGDGLKEDDQDLIFSEFYQLNNPERDRNKGLGLGLPIVSKISRLLDHPIAVKSRLGKGSCFSVDVPLLAPGSAQLLKEDVCANADVSGAFVLVVDDEVAIRDGMLMLLRSWECEVLTVAGGLEALHELQENAYPAPDILIVDYRLRGSETGMQVAEQVNDLFGRKIPTIIISGDTNPELDESCERQNLVLLRKPVEADHLKLELATLLGVTADES